MIINNQTAGVAINNEGTITINGDVQGTVVTDEIAWQAVRQLQSALPSARIDRATKAATLAQVAEIDAAMRAPRPDKPRIADALKRLTRLLTAAGSLTTAGAALIGPLHALASWLGALGDPILGLLRG